MRRENIAGENGLWEETGLCVAMYSAGGSGQLVDK